MILPWRVLSEGTPPQIYHRFGSNWGFVDCSEVGIGTTGTVDEVPPTQQHAIVESKVG